MYENLKGKTLLFLGAIRALCEPVEMAKEMGIHTIVIDYYPDSPAKKVADEAYLLSTTDVDAVVEFCKEHKVDGLFTAFIDSMLPYAREICDRMGWPFYASKEQIRMSLDKRFFKECCRKYGVPVPEDYGEVYLEEGANSEKIHYPVIVKPVDSSGGRGIKVCYSADELEKAYSYALSISPGKNVLVEQYIVGDEVTATYTMKNGEVSLSCFKDKLISYDHPGTTAQCDILISPSVHIDSFLSDYNMRVISMMKGMKATDGTAFLQGIAHEGLITFFEIGYRPNGGFDYRYISKVNHINFLQMMIAHALTGEMQGYDLSEDNPRFSSYCITMNLFSHGGTIGQLSGLDKIETLSNVMKAEYVHDIGDNIVENNTLAQRVCRVQICDPIISRIKESINTIQQEVKVTDYSGNNLLYSPFDTERLNKYKPDLSEV